MKNHILTLATSIVLLGQSARAEDVNLSEKADTTTVSLSPYSLGFGTGVFSPINQELRDRSPAFLKLTIMQSISFADRWTAGLDMDWLLPGQNWGGELCLDYLMGAGAFQPFIGAGGGIRYFDKRGSDFGRDLGTSGTVHVGLLLDVMDEMQLRIRAPFTVVANDVGDRGFSIDVGVFFSSPQRTTKVRKLKY